jgi:hypothetical protein
MSSHTSNVRGVTPIARQYAKGCVSRSMMRQRIPCRASSLAKVKPTGPAPTISTSARGFLRRSLVHLGGHMHGFDTQCALCLEGERNLVDIGFRAGQGIYRDDRQGEAYRSQSRGRFGGCGPAMQLSCRVGSRWRSPEVS